MQTDAHNEQSVSRETCTKRVQGAGHAQKLCKVGIETPTSRPGSFRSFSLSSSAISGTFRGYMSAIRGVLDSRPVGRAAVIVAEIAGVVSLGLRVIGIATVAYGLFAPAFGVWMINSVFFGPSNLQLIGLGLLALGMAIKE